MVRLLTPQERAQAKAVAWQLAKDSGLSSWHAVLPQAQELVISWRECRD
jgi:hypothetical protein